MFSCCCMPKPSQQVTPQIKRKEQQIISQMHYNRETQQVIKESEEEVVFNVDDVDLLISNIESSEDMSLLKSDKSSSSSQPVVLTLHQLKDEIITLNSHKNIKSLRQQFRTARRAQIKDITNYMQICCTFLAKFKIAFKNLQSDQVSSALKRFQRHDLSLYWESTADSDIGLTVQQAEIVFKMMDDYMAEEWKQMGATLGTIEVQVNHNELRKLYSEECLKILRFRAEDMVAKEFEVEIENLHAAVKKNQEKKQQTEPYDPKMWQGFQKENSPGREKLKMLESIYEEDNESRASTIKMSPESRYSESDLRLLKQSNQLRNSDSQLLKLSGTITQQSESQLV